MGFECWICSYSIGMKKRLNLIWVIFMLLTWKVSTAVNFKAPPAINKTALTTFANSPNDNKLIISPKLESLEL